MERNQILLAGKKIIKGLLVSSIVLASAQADFLMTLTDKNGVEENLCVKSYSFSNNLVSLHNKSEQYIDEYSTTKEVLTNKTWDGKPVYRSVVPIADFTIPSDGNYVNVYSEKIFNDIDEIVYLEHMATRNWSGMYHSMSSTNSMQSIDSSGKIYTQTSFFDFDSKRLVGSFRINVINFPLYVTKFKFIFEYTKTTDTANTNKLEPTSYVHYIPSDSTTNQLLSKSLKETGIRFLNDYTYDASTNSCIAPAN